MSIIKRKCNVKAYINRETVCEILIDLGFEASTRKNFKIRDERTASTSIDSNGNIKDFGGDFSGDIIDFLKMHFGISFFEAVEYLENYFGITPNSNDYVAVAPPVVSKKKEKKRKYNLKKIKRDNKRDKTPINTLTGYQALYPFATNTKKIDKFGHASKNS